MLWHCFQAEEIDDDWACSNGIHFRDFPQSDGSVQRSGISPVHHLSSSPLLFSTTTVTELLATVSKVLLAFAARFE